MVESKKPRSNHATFKFNTPDNNEIVAGSFPEASGAWLDYGGKQLSLVSESGVGNYIGVRDPKSTGADELSVLVHADGSMTITAEVKAGVFKQITFHDLCQHIAAINGIA